MYNIMQSILKSIWKTPISWIVIAVVLLIDLIPLMDADLWTSGVTASETVGSWALCSMLLTVYFVMGIADFAGFADFTDKTVNYEILAGHSREQVYWSRTLIALGATIVSTAVICLLPLVLTTSVLGWGEFCDPGWLLIRYGLLIIILVRTCSESVLLTVITGNPVVAMIADLGIAGIGMLGGWLLHFFYPNYQVINGIFWIRGALSLTDFNAKMGFADGVDKALIDATVSTEMMISILISSAILMVLSLTAGHIYMKRKEMA